MCNNYLQETAIKIFIRFSVKTYNNLKMTDMIVYIKCGLQLGEDLSKKFDIQINNWVLKLAQ